MYDAPHYEAKVRRDREEKLLSEIFPNARKLHEELVAEIEETAKKFSADFVRFRREIVGSPYERLTLAASLIDMCEADASELLKREVFPSTCDDVLVSIEKLAAKVRALKERADASKPSQKVAAGGDQNGVS